MAQPGGNATGFTQFEYTFGVNAMDLENRLCDVETDRRNRLHGPVLRIGSPHGDHGTYAVSTSEVSFIVKAFLPAKG